MKSLLVTSLLLIAPAVCGADTITFDNELPWKVVNNGEGNYRSRGYAFTPTAGNAIGHIVAGSYQPEGNPLGNQALVNNGTPNLMCGNHVNLRFAADDARAFDLTSVQVGGTFNQEVVHRWSWASFVNIIGHRTEGGTDLTERVELDSDFSLHTITLNWTGLAAVDFIPERSILGMGANDYEFTLDSLVVTTISPTDCDADFNNDGFLDFTDFDAFVFHFELGSQFGDFNRDGFLDFTDFDAFVAAFEAGC